MKYFINRQSPGIDENELEKAFKAFVQSVSEEWLCKSNYHPLRELWKRKDILATNELYSIGTGIEEMSAIDPLWLRSQIKLIKSAEKNNYLGAFAEILGIYLLNGFDHPLTPAKANQAGYDAIMSLPSSGKTIRLSIKNYGMSKHEENFSKWANKTEELIKKLLKRYKYYPVTIWIDCPTEYPSQSKWELLHSKLDRAFELQKNAAEPFTAICTEVPEWIIIISPHIASQEQLHPSFNSYTLIISSVYHPNENENLLSKIHDACSNLTKHSSIENDLIKNFLFIHLSPLASIKNCKEWLDHYFIQFPAKPISAVLFYQPSVVSDLAAGTSSINHFFYPYLRQERMDGWLPLNFQFLFKVPLGTTSFEPALYALNFTFSDGKTQQISVDDRYLYQRGNHYVQMQADDKGGYSGNINQIAPGVFSNIVIEFPNQPGQAVIAGRFPPSDDLLIL